jgi:hypothetical protein
MDIFITFDVERHSFETNTQDNSVVSRIEEIAIPKILNLLSEYNAKATFFTTAVFAEKSPNTINKLLNKGHELGCHGYDHNDFYDSLSLNNQIEMLKQSKKIIESISNTKIVSFRAPALRVNKNTIIALEKNNFMFDSSVAPQRFDGPFTSGAKNKLHWITAHRKPYRISHNSPFKKGNSDIIEIPISSIIWPFIGTHLRISPSITFFILKLLMFEALLTNKPLVFLIHPQEMLSFKKGENQKEANIFSGKIRHQIKQKNLGEPCFELFVKILKICEKNKINFKTIKEIEL